MKEIFVKCFSCGKEISLGLKAQVMRNDECPFCTVDLHCCKMCDFFDATVYNECREPSAERVVEKEKSNFCEFFTLNLDPNSAHKKKETFLSAAEKLFKK